jgi:putative ABC transport system permease protein
MIAFSGFLNSMKKDLIGAITGGLLGDIQVHANGYVASIENLPLYLSINESELGKIAARLMENPDIAAFTPRIKFGGTVSNYMKTSGMRMIAVDPSAEMKVCPNLSIRVTPSPDPKKGLLRKGEIILSSLLANGLSVKTGDDIVVLANNREGSVNALTLKVAGRSGSITDPSGRDAYLHIEDAMTLLRMDKPAISEVAIRLKNSGDIDNAQNRLSRTLAGMKDGSGKALFESHTWRELSPVATFITVMDIFQAVSKVILIVVVLLSIMNVMLMSVFERVNEIGTLAAIGTVPSTIVLMFLSEGILIGISGAVLGTISGFALNWVLGLMNLTMTLGHMMKLTIQPFVVPGDVLVICAIVIVVAAAASLEPAIRAAKLAPVDAMRHS